MSLLSLSDTQSPPPPKSHVLTQSLLHFIGVPCMRRREESSTTFEIRLKHHSLLAPGHYLLGETSYGF